MAAIRADQLADAVIEELENYSEDVTEGIKKAVIEAAKDCKSQIQSNSPVQTGSYKKGWRIKKAYESPTDIRLIIHNKTDYQLVHLLENGHAKVTGGRVPGHPHVAPAAEAAARALESKAKVVVKG